MRDDGRNNIYREANNKKGTGESFRYETAYRKVTYSFLNSVNKQARYSVLI